MKELKDETQQFYTIAPVKAADPYHIKPEFIRMPKPGTRCPWTGLSRGKMNQLVLPCPENDHMPAVRSVSLRPKGSKNGVRLIFFDSLMDYLKRCETDWSKETEVVEDEEMNAPPR